MEKLIYYKRYPERALEGMADLTPEECGVYNRIIDMLYARQGVLNLDDATMARRNNCHGNKYLAIKKRLIEKGKIWVTEDGGLMAKGVEAALKEAGILSETQRIRVGKRWETSQKPSGNDPETPKNPNENNDPPIRAGNTNIVIVKKEGEGGEAASPTPAEVIPITRGPRGTRLDPAWSPGREGADFARELGMSNERMKSEFGKFQDHFLSVPGQRGVKLDWMRTWKKWARSAVEGNYGGRPIKPDDLTPSGKTFRRID